eukprot:gene4126-biopygen828
MPEFCVRRVVWACGTHQFGVKSSWGDRKVARAWRGLQATIRREWRGHGAGFSCSPWETGRRPQNKGGGDTVVMGKTTAIARRTRTAGRFLILISQVWTELVGDLCSSHCGVVKSYSGTGSGTAVKITAFFPTRLPRCHFIAKNCALGCLTTQQAAQSPLQVECDAAWLMELVEGCAGPVPPGDHDARPSALCPSHHTVVRTVGDVQAPRGVERNAEFAEYAELVERGAGPVASRDDDAAGGTILPAHDTVIHHVRDVQ